MTGLRGIDRKGVEWAYSLGVDMRVPAVSHIGSNPFKDGTMHRTYFRLGWIGAGFSYPEAP